MEETVVAILRASAEKGLPRLPIGGNAVILLGDLRTTADIDLIADTDLPDFPVFDRPIAEPWPMVMSWSDAVREMAPLRDHYMQHHDSPEKRFADKNPESFILD